MGDSSWHRGLDPTRNLALLGEMTLRLTRLSLYRKLQQAESQLKAMGLENDLSTVFKRSSEEMLDQAFKKPEFACIRVDTTLNSTF
jgi:hypothetical protein